MATRHILVPEHILLPDILGPDILGPEPNGVLKYALVLK